MLTLTAAVVTALRFAQDVHLDSVRPLSSYGRLFVTFSAILLPFFVAYRIFVAPHFSANRHLPTVKQGPVLTRLFKEPNSVDFLRWIEEIPNDGLIRFHGVLNHERILITTTEGNKTVHDGDTKDFHRAPAARAILSRLV
jgi:hypothetical protein